jgi:hypothetical protein
MDEDGHRNGREPGEEQRREKDIVDHRAHHPLAGAEYVNSASSSGLDVLSRT